MKMRWVTCYGRLWTHRARRGERFNDNPSDYPDFAVLVGNRARRKKCERGIWICGSGVGVIVAANKIKGIRSGHFGHDTYSAHQEAFEQR